ncbi:MAG: YitT family protein [Calditrichia bacterium]
MPIKFDISLKTIIDYFFITFGSFIMAIGIGVFLVDAQVVPGGVSGLSMAFHYLSGNKLPVGMLMWVFNVPLFIWGIKELGKGFGFRTFYGFTVNSFFIDFLRGEIPGFTNIRLQDTETVQYLLKNDFFFLILLGAVFLGLGLGIIFKFKGTTAGSDIVAAIAQKRWGVKPGQMIMFTDFFVISFAGIIIQMKHLSPDRPAIALTLYAFLLLFLSSHIIDIIIDGFDYAKSAFIISDKGEDIGKAIMNKLSRGATAFHGEGLYRGIQRKIIYAVIDRKEVQKLRELVSEIDPKAFIIIENVHEVLGEGFRRRDDMNLPTVLKKIKVKKEKISPPDPMQEWE